MHTATCNAVRCSFSLSPFSVHLSFSLESTRGEKAGTKPWGHEFETGRPAGRPTDPFDHETCLLVIIARRFASPRGRVPRLVANTGCIIADASMRLARRYRINRNSREPCLFRLYALYTYIHADTNVFCRGSNFHVMRLVTRPTMHREILFLSSEVLLRRTEFRIQTHVTHNVFIRLHLSPISKLPYRTILCEIYIYSIFANRANDQLLDSRRQRSEIESESKNI